MFHFAATSRLLVGFTFLLRYPAALMGVLSAAAVYALGRRLSSHLSGVLAAALMSVLHIAIYYSQEARPYAALIAFTTLSTYLWVRMQQTLARGEAPGPGITAGYVLCALLGAYWNYYGLLVIALQGLGSAVAYLAPGARRLPSDACEKLRQRNSWHPSGTLFCHPAHLGSL